MRDRPANVGDVHKIASGMPHVKRIEGPKGNLEAFVHADAEPLIETGDPPAMICSAAGRLSADVLVIGRGSAAGVFGRLRANAYGIIRQSPCPVVSV